MNWLALIPLAVLLFFSHRTMYRLGRADARIDQQLADFERDGRVCDEAEVQP